MQLRTEKQYIQKAFQTIKQFAVPRSRELERELSAVREENQLLAGELDSVRNDFENTRNSDGQQIADLGQRITDIETEREAAHHQVEVLKTLLEEAASRQETTARQVITLESKLDEASSAQEVTARQVLTLEMKLGEAHSKQESILNTIQKTLDRVQAEQQILLKFQSDMAESFRKTRQHLLEAKLAEEVEPKHSVLRTVSGVGLLLLGALAGATTIWGVQGNARSVSGVEEDIKLSLERYLDGQVEWPAEQTVRENSRGPSGVSRDISSSLEHILGNQDEMLTVNPAALTRDAGKSGPPQTAPVLSGSIEPNRDAQEPPLPQQARLSESAGNSANRPASGKWDQPLLLEDTQAEKTSDRPEYDPLVEALQTDLLALGFDLGREGADGLKGARTQQALDEFHVLYFPVTGMQEASGGDQLASVVKRFADLAREDQERFNVDSGVLAAIRLGNMRTGLEFSFLMELAAAESAFDYGTKAAASSAAGLYQFTRDTWLNTVKAHGDKYGVGAYASQVEFFVGRGGKTRPMISDPVVYQHVLDLRYNPRISALLASEYIKDNMKKLSSSLERKPGRTELYLSHFFGAEGAISFLKVLEENPDEIAGDLFPRAAKSNRRIFLPKHSKPRTVTEVYEVLDRKFNTARYEDSNPG